ncbi:ATPase [Stutzerimonas tarimensis]|uniref:ATPase n=1 Tax=Stutzerimonas tarimensis TaxID=1507735 RepID=A0ABV7T1L9_9GAMM
MRNDANDDPDRVPSLSVRESDRPYPAPEFEHHRQAPELRQPRDRRRRGSTGLLWALVLLLGVALGLQGWWTSRQIALLETQLVATQDSFARISEDAAGRLSAITGQVVAAESTVTSESEAVKLRIAQLERQGADFERRQQLLLSQQESLADQQGGQTRRLEEQMGRLDEQGRRSSEQGQRLDQLGQAFQSQQAALDALDRRADALAAEQSKLLEGNLAQGTLDASLDTLRQEITALEKAAVPRQVLERLEQEVLVLRSELDARPATPTSSLEFDAFRAQMARNINTLQSQVANLQAQINARQQ